MHRRMRGYFPTAPPQRFVVLLNFVAFLKPRPLFVHQTYSYGVSKTKENGITTLTFFLCFGVWCFRVILLFSKINFIYSFTFYGIAKTANTENEWFRVIHINQQPSGLRVLQFIQRWILRGAADVPAFGDRLHTHGKSGQRLCSEEMLRFLGLCEQPACAAEADGDAGRARLLGYDAGKFCQEVPCKSSWLHHRIRSARCLHNVTHILN